MSETWNIQYIYFDWLYQKVFAVRDLESPESYVRVCTLLHSAIFDDSVPHDHNRAADAEELRDEFIASLVGIEVEDYADLYSLGNASVFEVLVALSRRADFIYELGPDVWFRKFLENIGLLRFPDGSFHPSASSRIERAITIFNERKYSRSGYGGIFPLQNAEKDQRHTELWEQMCAYANENMFKY